MLMTQCRASNSEGLPQQRFRLRQLPFDLEEHTQVVHRFRHAQVGIAQRRATQLECFSIKPLSFSVIAPRPCEQALAVEAFGDRDCGLAGQLASAVVRMYGSEDFFPYFQCGIQVLPRLFVRAEFEVNHPNCHADIGFCLRLILQRAGVKL